MDLLTPGTGLIFWQAVIFLLLLVLLGKFAWKPIMNSLRIREESIQEALDSAEKAKSEMAQLQADNQKLLEEARLEKDKILKAARDIAASIKEEAHADASAQTEKMISDAKTAIDTERQAALADVRQQVSQLSLQIAEKLLRKNLSDDKAQKELIEDFVKDVNLN